MSFRSTCSGCRLVAATLALDLGSDVPDVHLCADCASRVTVAHKAYPLHPQTPAAPSGVRAREEGTTMTQPTYGQPQQYPQAPPAQWAGAPAGPQIDTYTPPPPRTYEESDSFPAKDNVGKPLLVKALEVKMIEKTRYTQPGQNQGPKPGVVVHVVDLTTGGRYRNVLWMGGAVVDGLTPFVGRFVVVRLAWATARDGSTNYITLEPGNPQDNAYAQQYLGQFGDPFPPQLAQPQQAQGWQGDPVSAAPSWAQPAQGAPVQQPMPQQQPAPVPAGQWGAQQIGRASCRERV